MAQEVDEGSDVVDRARHDAGARSFLFVAVPIDAAGATGCKSCDSVSSYDV